MSNNDETLPPAEPGFEEAGTGVSGPATQASDSEPAASAPSQPYTDPGADEIPAPTVKPSFGDEDEAQPEPPKAPVAEPYGGEFKAQPNVELGLPIFEDFPGARTDEQPLEIPNLDPVELSVLRRKFYSAINNAQAQRHELVRQGGEAASTYGSVTLPDNRRVYLTELEAGTLQLIQQTAALQRTSAGHGLFDDLDSTWTNMPKHGDEVLAIRNLTGKQSPDPYQRLRAEMDLSIEVPVPLWNSGLHMKIRSQPSIEGLQLQTRMSMEKIDSGRETSGYIFSAPAIYMNRMLADFIIKHSAGTTAGNISPVELKKLIKITDLEPMALGAVAANHPKGYPMTRHCLTDLHGCGNIVERQIQPRRMLFVRRSRLTDNQLQHMSKRSGLVDVKSIKAYQKSLRPEVSRLVQVKGKIHLRLDVPSLYQFDRLASNWMSRLNDSARDLVPSNANESERELFLIRATNISQVMALSHWVEALVEFDENSEEGPITVVERLQEGDLEAQNLADTQIDEFLRDISDDPEVAAKIIAGIEKFINDLSLTAVCVPKGKCPQCGNPLSMDAESEHPHLVQVNAVELFFILLHLKILRAGG